MDLPDRSALVVHTLESPWFLAALLVIAAVVAWVAFRYRAPKPAQWTALGLLAAAVGLIALARLIETTGERLSRETRSLVEAAVNGDAAAFGERLDPTLVLRIGPDRSSLDHLDLVERVRTIKSLVKSNNIRDVLGTSTGPDTGESVLAQTTVTAMGEAIPNQWRFRWRRDSSGRWKITEMIWERWMLNQVPTAGLLGG
ncbi:MAG: hypothetical protein IT430_02405 [Phycisphaerales bacterium]|nr:hypothetical protein [Phycisphaerales bacterium]